MKAFLKAKIFMPILLFFVAVFVSSQAANATNVAVTLITPEDHSKCVEYVDDVIEFSWNVSNPDDENIDSLVLNIYGNTGLIWSKKFNSDETSFNFDKEVETVELKYFTPYYWRFDVYVEGVKAPEMQSFDFQITKEPLFATNSLEDNAACIGLKPNFYWLNDEYALQYTVQLAETDDFAELITVNFLSGNSATPKENLEPRTTYYWRIIDKDCEESFSETRTFKTIGISPELVFPKDLAMGYSLLVDGAASVALQWKNINDPIHGSDAYRVQINRLKTFHDTSEVIDIVVSDTFYLFNFGNIYFNQEYFWRVKVENSAVCGSDWSEVRSFTSPLRPVKLLSPEDEANCVSLKPTLKWQVAEDSLDYVIVISTDENFSVAKTLSFIVYDTNSVTTFSLEPQTKYFWKIRADYFLELDDDEFLFNYSDWSEVRSFTTATQGPTLISPANESMGVNSELTLAWKSAGAAYSYQIEIATSNAFTGIIEKKITSDTTFDFELLDNITNYFWRVKIVKTGDMECDSDWSAIWSFSSELGTPIIIKPGYVHSSEKIDTIPTTTALFKWEAIPSAENYDLEYTLNSKAFAENIINDITYKYHLAFDSLEVPLLKSDTIYYWRVRARNSIDTSDWSEMFRFRTGFDVPSAPALVSPANNKTFVELTPEFIWKEVALAVQYEVEIDTINNFANPVLKIYTENTSLELKDDFALKFETQYYWRVRAVNNGVNGNWSEVWNFTTSPDAPETAVALIAPVNNAVAVAPDRAEFTWKALEDAQSYRLQVSKTNDFAAKVVDSIVTNKTSCFIYNFELSTDYFWKVLPANIIGEGSTWSEIRKFTTDNKTSIFDFSYTSFVNVSPNPVNNFATCNFGLIKAANITLVVYDAAGNEVQRTSLECEQGEHSINLNIAQFASGNYLCKIVANNKIVASTQFIIAK